ncbi:MAG: hypothetical protein KF722_07540 [Nitrospira sp.]|nr:hypothetical protein [Nitrospira sp.]
MGRTSDRFASIAGADNFCLPIGPRFIKPTAQSAGFRDRGPGLLGSGNGGDPAPLWERNVAGASGVTFFHGKAARQLCCGSGILYLLLLRLGVEGGTQKYHEQQHKKTECQALNRHGHRW